MTTMEDNNALLLFRVGPVRCCAPSLPVRSIITPPTLTHPPGSSISRPGIFKYGNLLVSVMELRYLFGVEKDDWKLGRTIITDLEIRSTGFWVDEIIDVIKVPGKGWNKVPSLIPRDIFSQTLLLDEYIYLYTEFSYLANIRQAGILKRYIEQLKQQTNVTTVKDKGHHKQNNDDARSLSDPIQTATKHELEVKQTPLVSSNELKVARVPGQIHADSGKMIIKNGSTTSSQSNDDAIQTTTKVSKISSMTKTPDLIEIQIVNTIQQAKPPAQRPVRPEPPIKQHDTVKKSPLLSSVINKSGKSDVLDINPSQKPSYSQSQTLFHSQTKVKQDLTTPSVKRNNQKFAEKARIPQFKSFPTNREEEKSALWPIIVIVLLLIGTAGYFFDILFVSEVKQSEKISHYQKTPERPSNTSEDFIVNTQKKEKESPASYTPIPEIDATSFEPEQSPDAIIEKDNPEPESKSQQEVRDIEDQNNAIPVNTDAFYYADIAREGDDITIVLHDPDPIDAQTGDEVISPARTGSTVPSLLEHPETVELLTIKDKLVVNKSSAVIKLERLKVEIVHIVVKGDTLWAIAKRYVRNPFRYPELARLSKIKNPDLIYPGNRVRIIKYVKQK